MTFLPIVERELRAASRRSNSYWTRSYIALAATLVGTWFYGFSVRLPPQQVAQYAFIGLSVLALGYCLVSGRLFTADCLSGEKREGTLGLLFLTDLKGYDVVSGKLAATSLRGFYGLLAALPVLGIPLLMGGVTQGEFWRMMLVLVNTFFLSSGVGILVSALSREARRAFGANFTLQLLMIAVPPALAGMIYLSSARQLIPELLYSCPVYSFWLCFDAHYSLSGANNFWCSIAVIHAMSWVLVLLTSWIVPHCWQDRPSGSARIRWRDLWHEWSYGNAAARKTFRTRLLDVNAFYWLASRARRRPALVWSFLVFMVGWWLYVSVKTGSFLMLEALIATAVILNLTLKLWVPIEAAQRLAEDQSMGALELLLSTPLTVRDILRGQLMALRRQFLWPVLAVMAIELALTQALPPDSRTGDSRVFWGWMGGILLLLADVIALICVAMASAITSKSANHAIIKTLSRILVLPWILFAIIAILVNLSASLTRTPEPGWKFYLGLWLWLGLLTDFVFGLGAWEVLRTRFRALASRSLKPSKP
jgi:hypothetical protein